MKKTLKRKSKLRSQNGGVTSVIFLAVLVVVVSLFSFAYDIAHNITVRGQLQSAADAAALAGAYDLCLSGGAGATTATAAEAQSYSALASEDAIAICSSNKVDGRALDVADIQALPCQMGNPARINSNGYPSAYFMTVTAKRKVVNVMARLFGHSQDIISVTSVSGPIGNPASPTSATLPFPFAIYSPNHSSGSHQWEEQAGLETLDVGILPLLTNRSNSQFVSGPTGLLGGTLAVAGAGGNGAPTLSMMKHFDPSQTVSIGPPSLSVGQTIMLMNPGLTGLNLSLFPAGPLTVENYFQSGRTSSSFFGLLAPAPSTVPALAPFLQGKTFIVPVVTNPNCGILAMPLASVLKGGVAAQITSFVPVQFVSGNARPGSGLSALGIVVLPPDFYVNATVVQNASPAPINIGLVM